MSDWNFHYIRQVPDHHAHARRRYFACAPLASVCVPFAHANTSGTCHEINAFRCLSLEMTFWPSGSIATPRISIAIPSPILNRGAPPRCRKRSTHQWRSCSCARKPTHCRQPRTYRRSCRGHTQRLVVAAGGAVVDRDTVPPLTMRVARLGAAYDAVVSGIGHISPISTGSRVHDTMRSLPIYVGVADTFRLPSDEPTVSAASAAALTSQRNQRLTAIRSASRGRVWLPCSRTQLVRTGGDATRFLRRKQYDLGPTR